MPLSENPIWHVYTHLPSHNRRTHCCRLPPGVKLQQTDEFTLRGNPYPNENQLAMASRLTNFAAANQQLQRWTDGPSQYGQGVVGGKRTYTPASNNKGCSASSYETMWRLWQSNKVMQCPKERAAYNTPDTWAQYYH